MKGPKFDSPPAEAKTEGTIRIEKEKPFSLKDFLVQPKTDYGQLIDEEWIKQGRNIERSFGEALYQEFGDQMAMSLWEYLRGSDKMEINKEYEKTLEILREKISGRILVDLGSGPSFYMQALAHSLRVKVYIRVDLFAIGDENLKPDPSADLEDDEWRKHDEELFPGLTHAQVKADMLDFISRVPDESVCVTISGIDRNIIGDQRYHDALAREIIRVLIPGGLVFGTSAGCLEVITDVLKHGEKAPRGKDMIRLMTGSSLGIVHDPGFEYMIEKAKS